MRHTRRTTRGSPYKRGRIWWIDYYAGGKRRRESAGTTKRVEAAQLLAERIAWLRPRTGAARATLGEALAALQARYDVERRPCARRVRCALARVRAFFGEIQLRAVDESALYTYTQARLQGGAGAGTVRQELGCLRRALRLAHELGRLARVPRIRLPKEPPARAGFVERAQLEAILAALPEHVRPAVHVAALTGWRISSEILTRTWDDVDLSDPKMGWLRLQPGQAKSGQAREFPVVVELRSILERQLELAAEFALAHGRRPQWIFFRHGGQKLGAIYYHWRKAVIAAGCPRLRPHDLRRTAVRSLERARIPRSTAQQLVGHRSDAMYSRYAIVDSAMLREAGERLAAAGGGNA